MNTDINSLQFIASSFDKKQRELLLSMLMEEKYSIEHFKFQNEWVRERISVIDSIIAMIEN